MNSTDPSHIGDAGHAERRGRVVLTLVVDVGEGEAPERWPETKMMKVGRGR